MKIKDKKRVIVGAPVEQVIQQYPALPMLQGTKHWGTNNHL